MGRIIPFLFWKITLRFETTNHIYILNMCTTVKESARWVITVSSIVYSIVDVSGSTYLGTMKHWGYISQVVKLHQTEVDTHSALKLFIWSLKEPQKTTTIHKYTNKWHFIMWTIVNSWSFNDWGTPDHHPYHGWVSARPRASWVRLHIQHWQIWVCVKTLVLGFGLYICLNGFILGFSNV